MIYDVVIIGAGLGGLQCGYVLSKKGLSVCILEKEGMLGGCLQSFKRRGIRFDTGFHYVGGMDEGQALHRLMHYFDLLDLDWHRMDEEITEEIFIRDKCYTFPTGHERFIDTLSREFPQERENIIAYTNLLKSTGTNAFGMLDRWDTKEEDLFTSLFSRSAYGYLQTQFRDPALMQVVSATSLKLEPDPDKLPLYIYAQTSESYLESCWKVKGGSIRMVNRLTDKVREMGGCILPRQEVVELCEENGRIKAAVLKNGEQIEGHTFISNIHPVLTLQLLQNSKQLRPSYRKRITKLENSFGIFTVNIKLKEGMLPYLNRAVHIHSDQDVWSYHKHIPGRELPYVFVNYPVPDKDMRYAECIDLLTPMHWEEVSPWEQTKVGRRGYEYEIFKQQKAEECIELAAQYTPGLREAIDIYYTSTPLTWRDYTGTIRGSAYGIQKDYANLTYTMLSPKTPVSNLLLTGQNLSVHGIMGVSMTALQTCSQLLGIETILEDFNK